MAFINSGMRDDYSTTIMILVSVIIGYFSSRYSLIIVITYFIRLFVKYIIFVTDDLCSSCEQVLGARHYVCLAELK